MTFLSKCDDINGCGKTYPTDLGACPHCDTPGAFSSAAPIDSRDWIYDIETYPNCFTCRFIHLNTNIRFQFEISTRINQVQEFCNFVNELGARGSRLIGYNNIAFDYPVIHWILQNPWAGVELIYEKAMTLIKGDSFGSKIWPNEWVVEQLDLMEMNHFGHRGAKATSLKSLEFAMHMTSVQDLPFPVGTVLSPGQMDILHVYNEHDCEATAMFYVRCIGMIRLREELTIEFDHDFMNHNDVKIGKDLLVLELEKNGIPCYEKVNGRKQPRQTHRPTINLADAVFDYVKFERPEFEQIRQYFISKTITETKGVFNKLIATVDGLEYKFGTGGLHASVEARTVETTATHQIVDIDAKSFYPILGIKNGLFPEHLSELFCVVQEDMYNTRVSFAKSDPRNGAYKLALNGAFGGSNDPYSPFYDPLYTMRITINGQLLLCMLVEQLIKIPGLSMIQANTDGVTFSCPHEHMEHQRSICKWWESLTCLELEEVLYSRMYIRDVNNYIAVATEGKIKRIGCYAYETPDTNPATRELVWNKDHSQIVVAKAANAALLDGIDIRDYITGHKCDHDFMMRAKVPRNSNLVMRYLPLDYEEKLPNIIRYYVSEVGGSLYKISPPTGKIGTWKLKSGVKLGDATYNEVMSEVPALLDQADALDVMDHLEFDIDGTPHDERIHTKNKSKYETREMGISAGLLSVDCSDVTWFNRRSVDYEYYINETRKLVEPLL